MATSRSGIESEGADEPQEVTLSDLPNTQMTRPSSPIPPLEVTNEPRLQLCSSCTATVLRTGVPCEVEDLAACISCELIANASPSNNLPGATKEREREKLALYTGNADGSINLVDPGDFRTHAVLRIDAHRQNCPLDISEVVDFRTTVAWLAHCERVHGTQCNRRDLPGRYSEPIDIILVDVIHNCLVRKTTGLEEGSLGHPGTLPQTVSDAMLLTREMGEQYLWVDCLSVIQDSPSKHQDITNMDVIFARAELTIVASCVQDAKSALPGIRRGTRRSRTMSKRQSSHLISLYVPTSRYGLVNRTAYNSRGWTFQELLFSKRILFISQYQVCFHCAKSRRSESLPMERPHDTQYWIDELNLSSQSICGSSYLNILRSYNTLVQEYCCKRLSFQSDVENAFAGLASILEVWCGGSPVIHGMMSSSLACCLMWMFEREQYVFSRWTEAESGKKREGFPTWSWVAWPASITNISQHVSKISLPLLSLVTNIEVVMFNERRAATSWTVMDQTCTEHHATSSAQQIHINLNPKRLEAVSSHSSTLSFNAQRIPLSNFSIERTNSYKADHLLKFGLPGGNYFCGILSVAPNPEICAQTLSQDYSAGTAHGSAGEWSLVRLYHIHLKPWDGVHDAHELMLEELKHRERYEPYETLRKRLEQSGLLFVLVVRHQGIFWERMGAGYMIKDYWPTTDSSNVYRSYQERIVLV